MTELAERVDEGTDMEADEAGQPIDVFESDAFAQANAQRSQNGE